MEEQVYSTNITGYGPKLNGNIADKTPIASALSNLNGALNQLGDEVDRIGSRTSSARNIVPTEAINDESKKEYGSPLFAELSRLNAQANQILRNLQGITAEIEL